MTDQQDGPQVIINYPPPLPVEVKEAIRAMLAARDETIKRLAEENVRLREELLKREGWITCPHCRDTFRDEAVDCAKEEDAYPYCSWSCKSRGKR